MIVLSCLQARAILSARQESREECAVSLDLNLTESRMELEPEGVSFSDGQSLSWQAVEAIAEAETVCYRIANDTAEPISFYSEMVGRFYSLMPTRRAPTMRVAGFPMHRIKGIDPHEDTLRKIRTIAPVAGSVLDTTTGLGYTAIEAARKADSVLTIELDPTALMVARLNPWSHELFANPKITQRIGNAYDVVQELPDASFARIFHDPPTFSLAGELYSEEFYGHLHRLLTHSGRLFHYIGNLNSPHGRTVSRGVIRRLKAIGFSRVLPRQEAFGVVGLKG